MSRDGDAKHRETPLRELSRVENQAAALAFLPDSDQFRFVLVTSRRTRRWIFPKGGIARGLDGPATAAREAWEEAGVLGRPEPGPIGTYRSRKVRPPRSWKLKVEVFPVAIDEVREEWPEAAERARRFVTVEEARGLLTDPEMLRIAERFAALR